MSRANAATRSWAARSSAGAPPPCRGAAAPSSCVRRRLASARARFSSFSSDPRSILTADESSWTCRLCFSIVARCAADESSSCPDAQVSGSAARCQREARGGPERDLEWGREHHLRRERGELQVLGTARHHEACTLPTAWHPLQRRPPRLHRRLRGVAAVQIPALQSPSRRGTDRPTNQKLTSPGRDNF